MSTQSDKIRFTLWYDFRNPAQWRQCSDRLYREILCVPVDNCSAAGSKIGHPSHR